MKDLIHFATEFDNLNNTCARRHGKELLAQYARRCKALEARHDGDALDKAVDELNDLGVVLSDRFMSDLADRAWDMAALYDC